MIRYSRVSMRAMTTTRWVQYVIWRIHEVETTSPTKSLRIDRKNNHEAVGCGTPIPLLDHHGERVTQYDRIGDYDAYYQKRHSYRHWQDKSLIMLAKRGFNAKVRWVNG
jgi:hypothetical protein